MKARISALPDVPIDGEVELQSGQTTAKKAAGILVAKAAGFQIPTARQKQNLLVAFAKKGKAVYGKAFDIVRVASPVDLDDLANLEENLHCVTIFEIKSTRKALKADFSGYFFALTAAEVLVAQSLKSQFKFFSTAKPRVASAARRPWQQTHVTRPKPLACTTW